MKIKKIKIMLIALFVLSGIAFAACSSKKPQDENIAYYTCPMHSQIHEDKPGQCPICHMTLVPVYKDKTPPQAQDRTPVAPKPGQTRLEHQDHNMTPTQTEKKVGVMISPEDQSHMEIKTATVVRKNMKKTFQTFGEVAFDPDLVVAQTEYLQALRVAPELKQAARQRLLLLGMSEAEIQSLASKASVGTDLYLPQSAQTFWVYATLYPGDETGVVPGIKVWVTDPQSKEKWEGVVRGITPVANASSRATQARIEVTQSGAQLKPQTAVDVAFEVDLGEALVIPRGAYLDTGERQLAYVVHGGEHFQQQPIHVANVVGDEVVVTEGLQEGDVVAASALFLVDSEAQLKGGVAQGHQH